MHSHIKSTSDAAQLLSHYPWAYFGVTPSPSLRFLPLPHLELLWVLFLPQFQAKLLSCVFQPADLLGGLGERLLQLVKLLLFLLLQPLLDARLLLLQELPQMLKLGSDQLLQVSRSLLKEKEGKTDRCVRLVADVEGPKYTPMKNTNSTTTIENK